MNIQHEKVEKVSHLVRRITADNPGIFTGPGTNTYLLGLDETTVIDPGPGLETHCETIMEASRNTKEILVTHTHLDHSPGAKILGKQTGAPIYGLVAKNDTHQDSSFRPTALLRHNQVIDNSDYRIRVIHTPGHASNHLCFLLEEEGILFSGDHIMEGSTVVIKPPDGNMSHYLDSLNKLKSYSVNSIAPGHGHVIDDPSSTIDWITQHRMSRESKVFNALKSLTNGNPDSLVDIVYADVDVSLYPYAKWSLEAHLIKLVDDGRILKRGDQYCVQ